MAFGFVVARFGLFLRELERARGTALPESGTVSAWTGTVIICIGVVLLIVSGLRFGRFAADFRSGLPARLPSMRVEIALAIVMAAIGLSLAVYITVAR
jgi:putative membrane protein